MRWLMLCFLVSLVALLVAAAGVARHIWLQHRRLRLQSPVDTGTFLSPDLGSKQKARTKR
jgi:hypothetical protein